MILSSADYLEHYGKQGMRWGQRRAVNRAHTRKQKAEVALVSAGAGFLATRFVASRTLNTNKGLAAGLVVGGATKKYMDNFINKKGTTKVSSLTV